MEKGSFPNSLLQDDDFFFFRARLTAAYSPRRFILLTFKFKITREHLFLGWLNQSIPPG